MAALVSACSDDPSPKDEFNINIVSPSNVAYVQGEVSIVAEASLSAIAGATVFVDNVLFQEIVGNTINVAWDSRTVADGTHVIKVVARDANGQESSKELEVEVLNNFVTLNIPAGYMASGVTKLFFFSDQDGNVLTVAEAENAAQLVFATPSTLKPGDAVTLSIFTQGASSEDIESFSHFKPGVYHLKKPAGTIATGTHRIQITSAPEGNSTWTAASENIRAMKYLYESEANILMDVPMGYSTADIFLSHSTGPQEESATYRLLTQAEAGATTIVDFSTFTPMDMLELNADPTSTFSMSIVKGLEDPDNDMSILDVWERFAVNGFGDPTKFQIIYPGSLFPRYVFTNIFTTETHAYKNQHVGASPPLSVTPIEADITAVQHEGATVLVTSSGTYDYIALSAFSNATGQRSFNWSIFVPPGESRVIKIPNIPNEVKAKTNSAFENLEFKGGIISDYESLDGYDAYLEFIFNMPDTQYLSFREKNPA